MPQRRDVLYCEGSGDLVRSYEAWKSGIDLSTETSVTFSGQFFDMCRDENLTAHAVSSCSRSETVVDPSYTAENMPRWECKIPKVGYEITVIFYAVRLLLLAWRIRPKVIFVSSGVSECLYLSFIKLSGARIVYVLHNTLWPEGYRPTGPKARFRAFGERLFLRYVVSETLAVSPAAARQAESVGARNIVEFRPTFPVVNFAVPPSARPFRAAPFRVLFAGRIEQNKGVFDVLKIAEGLRRRERRIEFVLCGTGNALDGINRAILELGLQDWVRTTGKLDRVALVEHYLNAHAVIVPTTSSFSEGFAMVVAEAILLLRPVITSSVVPAAEVLRDAVVFAKTDDVASYIAAIGTIANDETYYLRLVDNARRLRPFILDNSASFFNALKTSFHRIFGSAVV